MRRHVFTFRSPFVPNSESLPQRPSHALINSVIWSRLARRDVVKLDKDNCILVSQGLARIRLLGWDVLASRPCSPLPAETLRRQQPVTSPRHRSSHQLHLDGMGVGIECLPADDACQALAIRKSQP